MTWGGLSNVSVSTRLGSARSESNKILEIKMTWGRLSNVSVSTRLGPARSESNKILEINTV